MTTLSAIVLAGGQSTRMGQDKALLMRDGVPLLRRVCEAALQCANSVTVVTAWGDRYTSILPPTCKLVAEQPLPGETEPHGPLVGFAQGLVTTNSEWVLLLACDLPNMTGAVLQEWTAQLAGVSEEAIALLPRRPEFWEPLCGFYHRRCLQSLQSFIQMGGRSFQGWLSQECVEILAVSNFEVLKNCNTPEDWSSVSFK